jgi:glycosyltransferase involved in cell wall biosynthesis
VNPLVSVIITTYNSTSFIIDTFESIAGQTWQELELVVTDDCSTDNTVEVSRQWMREKRDRFYRAELLTTVKNKGVSANANRGLRAAKGEWIKFLGADDTLKTNCIADNMEFVASDPGIKVLFSQVEVYKDNFNANNLLKTIPGVISPSGSILSTGISAESQYKMLLLSDRIHFTPSLFIHRDTLLSVGGFDERFPLLEDYPLWLNLTKAGHRLCFMDKVTVNYRRHSAAINNTNIDYLIKPNYFRTEKFRSIYTYPNLPWDLRMNARFSWFASQVFRCNWLNINNKRNILIHSILTVWLNPFRYYIWLRKRFNKELQENGFYV